VIRIVGVQRAARPEQEFVLLQNQGGIRLNLRGHVVLTDAAIDTQLAACSAHAFADSEFIAPGGYVLLRTCEGNPGWYRQKDGTLIYHAYMGQRACAWNDTYGQLHILSTQHTYAERREPALMLR
jgi:hypothetical protein